MFIKLTRYILSQNYITYHKNLIDKEDDVLEDRHNLHFNGTRTITIK